jgi:hypothetical protein
MIIKTTFLVGVIISFGIGAYALIALGKFFWTATIVLVLAPWLTPVTVLTFIVLLEFLFK